MGTSLDKSLVDSTGNNKAIITSLYIAEKIQTTHEFVFNLIREHTNKLEEFGKITFETMPFLNVEPIDVAHINYYQTIVLMSCVQNSWIISEFIFHITGKLYQLNIDSGYMTITTLFKTRNFSGPTGFAIKLARKTVKECSRLKLQTRKVPDERYGEVNSYPTDVLKKCFDDLRLPPPIPKKSPPEDH